MILLYILAQLQTFWSGKCWKLLVYVSFSVILWHLWHKDTLNTGLSALMGSLTLKKLSKRFASSVNSSKFDFEGFFRTFRVFLITDIISYL